MHETEEREDTGTVVAVLDGAYRIELIRGGGCKSCTMRGMCFAKSTPAVFELKSELPLKVGDRVQLVVAPGDRILSSVLIFLMPIVFLFAGFLIASRFLAELPSIIIAFTAMGSSFLILRLVDRRIGDKLKVQIGGLCEDTTE
ncbi:MAG TPA: SoxR reducing system RseC family protein [Candidatus Cloacimonadota bacterium]|nr:SoxR reducing system RseC family protein [Candidatus Cloacimonadota bacterium]